MPRLRLLLIDAMIVIRLHQFGQWEAVVGACDVHLSRGIVNETRFYDDLDGVRHSIDLKAYEENRRIIVHEVTLAETESLRKQFGQDILEKLDPGEAELLAVLVSRPFDEYLICSADRIVYRVLGALKISEQGISLEEVLKAIGITKNTEYPYIKAFREQWSRKGFEEGMTGLFFL